MDIIKTASAAKAASLAKRADTPGNPYKPGGIARPTYQGRYTRVPGGVVKYQPKTIGYHNATPAAVTKGKDIVDINAQGTQVAAQNNLVQVRNEQAIKATQNTAKKQNAALPKGSVVWNEYKGSGNSLDRNAAVQSGRVRDDAATNVRRNTMLNYKDKQVGPGENWGWWDRVLYNNANPGNSTGYVEMRSPEQIRDTVRGASWDALKEGAKALWPGGPSPKEAFQARLQQELANVGKRKDGTNIYRPEVQQFGVNVMPDSEPGAQGAPNTLFHDLNGNEIPGYIPNKHYKGEDGVIAPNFNDYNHDVRTRADGILRYLGVGASPNARNTDLQAKSQALMNSLADWRSDPNLFNLSTGWTQQAIDSVLRNTDFVDIYNAAKAMPGRENLDPRRLAQLFLTNGASLLWTR